MKIVGWQRVLLIIVPYFFIAGLFQFAGSLVAKIPIDQMNGHNSLCQDMILMIFSGIGTLIVVFFFVKYVDKEKFIQIGLSFSKRFSEIGIALFMALLAIGVGWLIIFCFKQLEILRIEFDPGKIAVSIAMFGIIAFSEEILFRAYILRNLLISFSKLTSLIVSSLLFVMVHTINPNLSWISILSLFFSGIALGTSYVYTKNLWFPIGLHFGWNFFQTLLGFNVSGQDSYSIIEISINKNTFINGGEFGFEGSVLSLIFEILIIVLIYKYYNKKNLSSDLILH